jgi:hypothetical protein
MFVGAELRLLSAQALAANYLADRDKFAAKAAPAFSVIQMIIMHNA